jgi:DNA invertase Pin-like site-specific DNA recombinase
MKRCAIYTRKSTDEGLDQSFNSLDAQREACQAFILSQRHEGWMLVKKAYDDGGFSGGSMERPALKQLLVDIRSGLVDIVVVYKIDRLTRSLADFAKMVEVFDARAVSFVSVTQQFNTTTSMGRLTLNVLLSFAQFEREVTAERIRDKIAASKKKGMWMGGLPPLGYDIRDKKLVVNPQEAQQVRRLFEAYLDLGSTKALTRWARENGIITKVRRSADGRISAGGRPFSSGNLHALLKYRTYIGEVAHKGSNYPGDHDAILTRNLWDRVQARLAASPKRRGARPGSPPSLPLTGLIFDETGDRLTPVHATKSGCRYYYYVSSRLNQTDTRDPSAWRLPAPRLERVVAEAMLGFFDDHRKIQDILEEHAAPTMKQAHVLAQSLNSLKQLTEKIQQSDAGQQLQIIVPVIHRIDLGPDYLTIRIDVSELLALIRPKDRSSVPLNASAGTNHAFSVPLVLKRRGVETMLVIGGTQEPKASPDQHLIRTIARARAWFEDLKSGAVASINDIAARVQLPASEVSRQLPLAFLAPSIVSAILAGRQPVDLTAKTLMRLPDLPLDWSAQFRRLGFPNN